MGPTLGTAFQECRIGESQFCVIDEKKEFHWRRKIKKVDNEDEKKKLLSTNGSTSTTDTDGGTGINNMDGEKVIKSTDSKKLLENLNNSTNVQHSEDFSQVKLAGLESTMSQGQDFIIPDGMYGDTNIMINGELSDNTRNRSITPLNTHEISQTQSVSNSNNLINNDNENDTNTDDVNEIESMREEATPDTIVEEPIPQDLFMNTENINNNENNNILNDISMNTNNTNNINNNNNRNSTSNSGGIVNTNYDKRSISIEERNEKRNSLIVPDNTQYSQKSVQEMKDLLRDYENQMSTLDYHKQQLSKSELANLKKNSDLDTSTGNDETEDDDESSDMDSESSDGDRRGTQHNVTSLGAPHIEIRQQSIEEMEMQLQALKLQNSLRDQNSLLNNSNNGSPTKH